MSIALSAIGGLIVGIAAGPLTTVSFWAAMVGLAIAMIGQHVD